MCEAMSCMFRPKCHYQTYRMDSGIILGFQGDKVILLATRDQTHVRGSLRTFQVDV